MDSAVTQTVELAQKLLRDRELGFAAEQLEELKPRLVLTPRQLEVTALTAKGLSAKEIAVALEVETKTVTKCREHIYQRLGFGNQIELTHWALRHRLVGNIYHDKEYELRGAVSLESVIADIEGITAGWSGQEPSK